ncbi:unnamed protein product [Discosporangium mesarthrocarpum]
MFDFNVKIDFVLSIDESMGLPPQPYPTGEGSGAAESKVHEYKGTLTLVDVSNSDVDNGKFDTEPELKLGKRKWDSRFSKRANSCIADLKAAILEGVCSFFQEYKTA